MPAEYVRRLPGVPVAHNPRDFAERNTTFVVLGALLAVWVCCASVFAQHSQLDHLDEYVDPYYPHASFPKLTTPQWVGEDGVDAVVTLAIDDMRDTAKYETYLRPILERLKAIDGRAPVSIMTCSVDPADPQLQTWLDEGLSIEVHTVTHPCPCLQGGDFAGAKASYDQCVEMMSAIEGNHPVAFRTPCCDSRNTPSPRLWNEIFNSRTASGKFLQADSSVFNVFTSADEELPGELVSHKDGRPRFRKYIPFPSFVNTIENYPYPYVIGKLCWQFPCMVPSDWEAQHLHQPNNPQTVADLKAALDASVIKQGMFNIVFHPHGWIRNDQIIELIDYAQQRYGKRVKFLTFRECVEGLNQNMLLGHPLRAPDDGGDNGIRIADLNADGYVDVMIGNEHVKVARLWQPTANQWRNVESGVQFTRQGDDGRIDLGARFGRLTPAATVSVLVNNEQDQSIYDCARGTMARRPLPESLRNVRTSVGGVDQGVRLRDLDHDGMSEIVIANPGEKTTLRRDDDGRWIAHSSPLPFAIVDESGRDNGLRLVDLDKDGYDDLIISNGRETGIHLYDAQSGGFTRVVKELDDVPLITRDGTNNGVWFAADQMWVQNEDTHRLPDGVDRHSLRQLLGSTEPGPRSPDLSLNSIRVRPGFTVELVAAEPLVMDPIALDWGPGGRLWVVEMADYPLGMDDKGKPGGRVRFLQDTDADGKYDHSTLFLDELPYPTGVIAWRDGAIVIAAPSIFFAADRDGDGKAEVREELFRGFGEGNQQHRVNGFERGLDHWLYLANGDSGGNIESVKTGKRFNLGSQDLRIRPSDGSMDLQSGRTQFGRHRDDHGNWFGCSNPIPVRHFVLADHYLRRNPFVAPPPANRDIARADNAQLFPISRVLSHWSGYRPPAPGARHLFTSACSTMVYRDTLFGDDFAQNTFTCEPVHNAIHRRRLVPSGVTFESVRPEDESDREFLASSDSWFRPTTVTTGPDGALWVTDMYRLVIEHPQWIDDQREKELFLRAGHDRGRIYRIYPTDQPPRKIEALGELDSEQLVERLASPNGRVRDLAQHLLIERNATEITAKLRRVAKSSASPLARLHALCTLDGLGALPSQAVLTALADEHPTVRRHGIRLSEPFLAGEDEAADDVLSALEACDARHDHVRLQLAYSLGASSSERAAGLLARIATESDDNYLRAAVLSSLGEDNVTDFFHAISGESATAARYQTPLLAMAARMNHRELLTRIVGNLLDAIGPDRLSRQSLDAASEMLATVTHRKVQLDEDLQSRIDQLAATALALATDHDAELPRRVAAIRFVATAGMGTEKLLELVAVHHPVDVQIAAATLLTEKETDALMERFQSLSPSVRSAILETAITRESTSLALIDAVRDKKIPLQAIGSSQRKSLLAHVSKKVKSAATDLFGGTSTSADKTKLLRQYGSVSPTHGNSERGQAIFTKHCSACHRVKGIGTLVGPDLAGIKNRSPEAMLTAILDPNAAVEDKYRSYSVLTTDGVAETGIIVSESSTAIELHMQQGKRKTILRDDIELIKSTGISLMPEEMERNISPSQMNDLLGFLEDLGPSPKSFEGNQPITVRSENGIIKLSASTCRIFGDQIRFEPQYKNIGFWGSPDDHVTWSFVIGKAGKHEVWLDYACPDDTAGNRFKFTCGDQQLTGRIEGTGSWDNYKQVRIGMIELSQDTAIAGFRGEEDQKSWLLDLRSIVLKASD